MKITICGAVDERLEFMCRALKAQVTNVALDEVIALTAAAATQPDLVILDLRKTSKVPLSLGAFRRQHPATSVLIVAPSLEPAMMLDAMRAGVNEFLAEPLDRASFDAAVARLVAHRQATAPGEVFAFVGAKGGVGTTTAAVNVATVLARATSATTLLIDLHLAYGDAAVFLGAEPRFSVVDALDNTHRFDETFFSGLLTESKAGPYLLASSDRPISGGAEVHRIGTLLEFASKQFRYVVLDVPRSDPAALDALQTAARIVVVTNQELATIRSAARMATSLRQRYGRERVEVVIDRLDAQSEIGHADVERVISAKVRYTIPSDYRAAVHALNKGQPIVTDGDDRVGQAFDHLARSLAGLPILDRPGDARSGGLFGRFGRR